MVSLPCDRNKGFTDLVHERMRTIDITKEEDGVGICSGAWMGGMRPIMSIQSSGLGNMMNAVMSLNACYRIPLVVLASWRGVDGETIEAQRWFNRPIPAMLDVFGIRHSEVRTASDIPSIAAEVRRAFAERSIAVILIHPTMWEGSQRMDHSYPPRARGARSVSVQALGEPVLTRAEAIRTVMERVGPDTAVVSNLGVPSKEVLAAGDRPLNFYMTGSYGQASPIGLGLAISSDREVIVIDGDGSVMCNWSLPVIAAEDPRNLTVVAMDNGTFGSTGHQIDPAYGTADIALIAQACGIRDVATVRTAEEYGAVRRSDGHASFVRWFILPGNSKAPDIPMKPQEITDRFTGAFRSRRLKYRAHLYKGSLYTRDLPTTSVESEKMRSCKTNPQLIATISNLKAMTRDNGSAIWRDVALRLEKPHKNWAEANLSKLELYAQDGETILVPGKVLAAGTLSKKITVAAYGFSDAAAKAIEAAGGKTMSIEELAAANPKGTGVRIMR